MDCRICGACCFGGQWVPVESSDDVPESNTFPGDKFYPSYMRMRCVCLKGKTKFSCAIYKDRPAACRAFEPGSPECIDKRFEMYGEDVPQPPAGSP